MRILGTNMSPKDPLSHKESFLAESQLFTELELVGDHKAIGKIEDIDVTENDVWLLQCPKGMDVKQLESQKLKMPGRSNLCNYEAVSVQFIDGKQQHAFAYYNHKGRYDLRLLPVRGTIVLRNRLKAADTITAERIEECCPAAKRVPMPSKIRVRHPLLGFQYEDQLKLSKNIVDRLQDADKMSAAILKESMIKNMNGKPKRFLNKPSVNTTSIEIDSDEDEDDDAVQFVSEEIVKNKKKKRKHSESNKTDDDHLEKKKKSKKSKKINEDEVSKDLQWLQNI